MGGSRAGELRFVLDRLGKRDGIVAKTRLAARRAQCLDEFHGRGGRVEQNGLGLGAGVSKIGQELRRRRDGQ